MSIRTTRRDALLDDFYAVEYNSTSVTARDGLAQRYLHAVLERPYSSADSFSRVIELGGNRGEHVPYVRHAFSEYVVTDIRKPELPANLLADPRLRTRIGDAARVDDQSDSFDRAIVTCLMHHVDDPLGVALELRRVVKPGGAISILLPTDPGWAYRVLQNLTSGRSARRAGRGAEFRVIHALDHRNHFRSIAIQLRAVFENDDLSVSWLPWHVPSVELSPLTVWQVRVH